MDQQPGTIGNFVVYRVFPSAPAWGRILSSLREGGILITTGYGKLVPLQDEELQYEPDIAEGGGIDVYGSPLPLNGNTGAIGMTPIAQFDEINFYKKIRHLELERVSKAILDNQ